MLHVKNVENFLAYAAKKTRQLLFKGKHFLRLALLCNLSFFSQESVKNICKLDVRGDFYYSYFSKDPN
jgi:hypothetical protein